MSAAPVPAVVPQDFASSLAFVLRPDVEGGYSATLDGGTNRGVRESTYLRWLAKHGRQPGDVKDLTLENTGTIYREEYWDAGRCDELPSPLGAVFFDALVQHGTLLAAAMLKSATAFPGAAPAQEAFALLVLRDNLYRRIAAQPSKVLYLKGWLARLSHLRAHVGLAPAVPS